ncbi:hypothetical protein [Agromyces humi]|uniref:hypothetical protein n=1 Tax=Agromyces humi TaxID=1766800 RepID=UPI0013569963|nr:hypothetical protein [Agromyces humi]
MSLQPNAGSRFIPCSAAHTAVTLVTDGGWVVAQRAVLATIMGTGSSRSIFAAVDPRNRWTWC